MSNEEFDFSDPKILRMKAEEKLAEKQHKIDKSFIETDVKKLLHELQVHQIELEMQNEELQQANETAEIALKKYTMLYDLAPLGYFTLEREGGICELNFTGADLLGARRFSLVNSNFKLFVSEESLPAFNIFLRDVFASDSKESCQIRLGCEKRPSCLVYIEGIVTGEDKRCLLSVVDISSFRKDETTRDIFH